MSDDIDITGRAQELLNVLISAGPGRWVSRAELAKSTGKNRLSPHDILLLNRLVEAGRIERQERKSNTPVGTAYEYRLRQ
jgi:hypothetical protein